MPLLVLGIRVAWFRGGNALTCSKKGEIEVLLLEHKDERLLDGGHSLVEHEAGNEQSMFLHGSPGIEYVRPHLKNVPKLT